MREYYEQDRAEEGPTTSTCRDALKIACCLSGVSLLFLTISGVIFFQWQVWEWTNENFFVRGPIILLVALVDVILIVSLIVKGGCPADPGCPHSYRSRWDHRNRGRYPQTT